MYTCTVQPLLTHAIYAVIVIPRSLSDVCDLSVEYPDM